MWDLPTTVKVNGKDYAVNTDYRDILTIFSIFNRSDMSKLGQQIAAQKVFYQDQIPQNLSGALEAMNAFINLYQVEDDEVPSNEAPLYDWDQDYIAIISDVNRVAGTEIRALPYLHWFTFMSYFHAIGEGQLSFLVGLRNKIRHGKKLEESEREFYSHNRSKIDLKAHLSYEEKEELKRIDEIFK